MRRWRKQFNRNPQHGERAHEKGATFRRQERFHPQIYTIGVTGEHRRQHHLPIACLASGETNKGKMASGQTDARRKGYSVRRSEDRIPHPWREREARLKRHTTEGCCVRFKDDTMSFGAEGTKPVSQDPHVVQDWHAASDALRDGGRRQ